MPISSIHVPPTGPEGAEVLIIGEAPGSDETRLRQPFVGKSGELLRNILRSSGFNCATADECETIGRKVNGLYKVRFANLCNYQPPNNKFALIEDTPELKQGLKELKEYIEKYSSSIKVCILLGEKPLNYILNNYGIAKWRGSALRVSGINAIALNHPAYVLRDRTQYPIFSLDVDKAFRIYQTEIPKLPFNFKINPQGLDFEEYLLKLQREERVAVDIETIKNTNHILSCAFATSRYDSICISNKSQDGLESEFRRFLTEFLENQSVKKIFHNGLFDIEVLHNNGIEVKNFFFDTQVAQHVLAPELPKRLAFITSIYTDIPYYKNKGKLPEGEEEKGWGKIREEDRISLYEYNCIDTCATFWCYEKMMEELKADDCYNHSFNAEMEEHDVAFHIVRSGMLVNEERRILLKELYEKKYVDDLVILNHIVRYDINVGSPKQCKELIYDKWKLPVKKDKKGDITTDEDAIVSLIGYTKDYLEKLSRPDVVQEWKYKLAGLNLILRLRGYRKMLSSYIDIEFHSDGRIRSGYKITGTETGRWSCDKYLDDTGLNAQTMPREIVEI